MVNTKFFAVENLCAAYDEKRILENISFDLDKHQMICLVGSNGSGKTTLIKSIVNSIDHQGRGILLGEELEKLTVRKMAQRVSYIPQRNGIAVSLPVLDVVLMGYNPVLKLLEKPSKAQVERAKKALDEVSMGEFADRDFLKLSEGQKQLVLIARMMIEETSLLLLDEPDSALDFQNRYQVLSHIKKMVKEEEKSAIICLHDMGLALEFCDKFIFLKDGCCQDIVCPKVDGIDKLEEAMKKIYPHMSLVECKDKKGNNHINIIWEG